MFLAIVRVNLHPNYKHYAATSHKANKITSSLRSHAHPRFSHSTRVGAYPRIITIPKVPSLIRLLRADILPDARRGSCNIDTTTCTRYTGCGGIMSRGCHTSSGVLPELEALYDGNRLFRDSTSPGFLKALANEGQRPPFMFLNCSDSRVCAKMIFSTKPGTIFATANIANQFNEQDLTVNSALSFAVNVLKVQHIVVMGHYGCGGVAAAFAPPSINLTAGDASSTSSEHTVDPVGQWIMPITQLYQISTRREIVEHREAKDANGSFGSLDIHNPAFRALVEENIKANVRRVAQSDLITGLIAAPSVANNTGHGPVDIFVHGWVYDIENGEVMDLDVSVGPPGKEVPKTLFRKLAA